MKEIKGYLVLRKLQNAGAGYFVITDTTGNRIHSVQCSCVKEENFVTKVLQNRGKNGRYYWVTTVDEVDTSLRVQQCSFCM